MLKIKQKLSVHLLAVLAFLACSCSTPTENDIENEELVERELNLEFTSSSDIVASSVSGHHYKLDLPFKYIEDLNCICLG